MTMFEIKKTDIKKDMCQEDIGLGLYSDDRHHCKFNSHKLRMGLYDHLKGKGSVTLTSFNFCITTSKMKIETCNLQ